jgi:hypothetical protein
VFKQQRIPLQSSLLISVPVNMLQFECGDYVTIVGISISNDWHNTNGWIWNIKLICWELSVRNREIKRKKCSPEIIGTPCICVPWLYNWNRLQSVLEFLLPASEQRRLVCNTNQGGFWTPRNFRQERETLSTCRIWAVNQRAQLSSESTWTYGAFEYRSANITTAHSYHFNCYAIQQGWQLFLNNAHKHCPSAWRILAAVLSVL